MTEEEKRAYLCGYVGIVEETLENITTVQAFLKSKSQIDDIKQAEQLRNVLDELYKKGIGIVTLYDKWTGGVYGKNLLQKMAERKNEVSASLEQWNIEIETERNTIRHTPICQEFKNGTKYLIDAKSKYFNVCQGKRQTSYQPQMKRYKRIYLFGPCFIIGIWVKDEETIASYLQYMINKNHRKYVVENCGAMLASPTTRILAEDIKAGDIVVCFTGYLHIDAYCGINLWDVCDKHNISDEYFVDEIEHCYAPVNKVYAEEIYDAVNNMEIPPMVDATPIADLKNDIIKDIYLNRYFTDVFGMLKCNPDMKIGSIVMNANPFTLGHRYLIEQAASRVDYLIVFVVEEDLSTFSFLERWWLVKKGTEDIVNLKIVPSGNFVLSQETFSNYFIKEESGDTKAQTEYDITLFADAIAKPLGIKYRFVGEELKDAVTRQYNESMKKILPLKGIEVVEIKRKESQIAKKGIISASKVRKLLETGKTEELADYLPETTIQYIKTGCCW